MSTSIKETTHMIFYKYQTYFLTYPYYQMYPLWWDHASVHLFRSRKRILVNTQFSALGNVHQIKLIVCEKCIPWTKWGHPHPLNPKRANTPNRWIINSHRIDGQAVVSQIRSVAIDIDRNLVNCFFKEELANSGLFYVYFRLFHKTQFNKLIMVCLGLEPGVAGSKVQTNPLSFGGTPIWSTVKTTPSRSVKLGTDYNAGEWHSLCFSNWLSRRLF